MDQDDGRSVLLTGGRGFIGSAVGKLLQREGYKVVSLDTTALASSRATEDDVLCDLTNAAQLQRVFEERRIGGIVHLAAILPTAAQRDPGRATHVNVEGSLQLLELARRFGVERFVFASSLSVYGTCSGNELVSEAYRAAPEDLYGAAKLYVERLGDVYRQSYGLEFVSLRIGRVVGPGAQSSTSAWRSEIFEMLGPSKAGEIALPYIGSERILLVQIDDVAKMLVALLRATRVAHAVYNAVCESVVVADLKRELERLNPNISVKLGEEQAVGNPRRVDSSRFQREFSVQILPIFERLRSAVERL